MGLMGDKEGTAYEERAGREGRRGGGQNGGGAQRIGGTKDWGHKGWGVQRMGGTTDRGHNGWGHNGCLMFCQITASDKRTRMRITFMVHLLYCSYLKYRVIQNDCRCFNNLSYTIHYR